MMSMQWFSLTFARLCTVNLSPVGRLLMLITTATFWGVWGRPFGTKTWTMMQLQSGFPTWQYTHSEFKTSSSATTQLSLPSPSLDLASCDFCSFFQNKVEAEWSLFWHSNVNHRWRLMLAQNGTSRKHSNPRSDVLLHKGSTLKGLGGNFKSDKVFAFYRHSLRTFWSHLVH